jgi:hypothetical protein
MESYMPASFIQLSYNNVDNDLLTKDPQITFFKKVYMKQEPFIKDEICVQDFPLSWNDTSYFKFPRDINFLGRLWVKVKIPYFQIVENIKSTTTTVTNNAGLNEMLFDNINTYLTIYEDEYYLIPEVFFQLPNINYNHFKIKFYDIKKYLPTLTNINISDDTDIILFSFNMNNFYSHDIIPLLLNTSADYKKITLNKLINGKDRYKKNMLTQNSLDYYLANLIENKVINNYQNIKKFDESFESSYFNFMSTEFNVLFNNKVITDSDIYKSTINYIDVTSISDKPFVIKENTILYNAAILQFLLNSVNPNDINTFTFYKKYAVYNINSTYNNQTTYDSIAKLLQQYWPRRYYICNSFL